MADAQVAAILRALAELAPGDRTEDDIVDVASGDHPFLWVTALAAELARNGVAVRTSYPVGRWEVDIVAGEGAEAVALDCEVHPDGPEAHLDRHRALRLAGWRTLDAFASRWDGDAARAAVELAGALRDPG